MKFPIRIIILIAFKIRKTHSKSCSFVDPFISFSLSDCISLTSYSFAFNLIKSWSFDVIVGAVVVIRFAASLLSTE